MEEYPRTATNLQRRTEMTSDVYQTIKQFFEDEMWNYIRLLFAIKLAELHEKHLVKFQAEKPMCPFLHEALVEVLRNLCKIILKPESVLITKVYKI